MSNTVVKKKPKKLVLKKVKYFADLRGFLKTDKKFNKDEAKKAYINDVVAGKI